MKHEYVVELLDKPIAQDLLASVHLLRMAYSATDGSPRVVPVAFYWDKPRIIVCTLPKSEKLPALEADPRVALSIDTDTEPPRALLIRGTATLETVDGVPSEYLEASKKAGGPEQWAEFEAQVTALYDQMVRITIEPDWAKLLDFETTMPSAVEEIVRRKQPDALPAAESH